MRELIVQDKDMVIPIGRRGEHQATCIKFPKAGWEESFGEGTFNLIARRPSEDDPYVVYIDAGDPDYVCWTVTNADTYYSGRGECELQYIVDNTLAKSVLYDTHIERSLEDAGEYIDPTEDWKTEFLEAVEKIEAAQQHAEDAAASATASAASAASAASSASAAAVSSQSATAARTAAEAAQTAAEAAATSATAASTAASTAKTAAEAAQTAAETAEATATAAATAAETAQAAAEAAQTATEAARDEAVETVETMLEQAEAYSAHTLELAKAYHRDTSWTARVNACTTKAQVDALFVQWWQEEYDPAIFSKQEMCERWFGAVLDDDKVHGVKLPLYATSPSPDGELTDDSVGLVCTPSTATTAGQDDFARLPQFWCLEVSAEKNADGTHDIYYVEHIDNLSDVRSGEHLTWVLQKNTWVTCYNESGYQYIKTRCHITDGYQQWPDGVDKNGRIYAYAARPKYPAGYDANGVMTCGTGTKPTILMSHEQLIAAWRARGAQYAGMSGSVVRFLEIMMALKYAKKGNSDVINGCSSYNYQYAAAASETGVKRVLVTSAQAANLLVGSNCMIGTSDNRTSADARSIATAATILSKETVTVYGVSYVAINFDVDDTFDTTAGTTRISTIAYSSGYNDDVLGTDGSRTNPAGTAEPGLLQKIEFMHGYWVIPADELTQFSTDGNGDYVYTLYKCDDQSKCTTSITSDYEEVDGCALTIDHTKTWNKSSPIRDLATTLDASFPDEIEASSANYGCKCSVYVYPAASALRLSLVFGYLSSGTDAGFGARHSNHGVSTVYWHLAGGSPGLPG